MFIHKTCNHELFINLSNYLRIYSTFGIGTKSIKPGQAVIRTNSSKRTKAIFYCEHCETDINPEEIMGVCGYCGEVFPPSNLFRIIFQGRNVGNVGCKECLDKVISRYDLSNPVIIPVENILPHVYFGESNDTF